MSMILGGTNPAVTFPDGTIQNTAYIATGSVLQVIQGVKSDRQTFSLTDNSYQDVSSLSASITPKSSSNKILVMVTIGGCGASVSSDLLFRLVRGSTAIALGDSGVTYLSSIAIRTLSAELTSTPAINYLDSPATTSSTTYKVQIASTGTYTGGVNLRTSSNVFGPISTITLLEIAA
jgi:hypothetical protein